MEELLFVDNKCLICGSKANIIVRTRGIEAIECSNRCCKYVVNDIDTNLATYDFYIFSNLFNIKEKRDTYGYLINDKKDYEIVDEIKNKIEYWKENERYICEILNTTKN